MKFEDLRLPEPILRAVRAEGYTIPTPIQVAAIPHVLEGRDVLGCAQTGTGKTAAFTLPILHRLGHSKPPGHRASRVIRVLVLAPTRELAAQIGESFGTYGKHLPLRRTVIFGGVNQNTQVRALRDGIDVLIATPGRLLDLMQQGYVDLGHVEVLVLDEADRMLDMGFIRDIRKIVAKIPTQRQTLLFSATIPNDIRELASAILRDPIRVNVAPATVAADTVEQCVFFVEKRNKPALLEHVLNNNAITRALVFTRTKHGADIVARHLTRAGIHAEAIHGNKTQSARVRAMSKFKSSEPPILVATDIAARGLDIDEISHVINYDVPNVPETYIHRIGRTGRAGASGLALSFCDTNELPFLKDIERLIRRQLRVNSHMPKFAPPEHRPMAKRPHPHHAPPSESRPRRQHASGGSNSHHRTHAAPATVKERCSEPVAATAGSGHSQGRAAGVGYHLRGRTKRRRNPMRRSR